jgi:hypothetical protein
MGGVVMRHSLFSHSVGGGCVVDGEHSVNPRWLLWIDGVGGYLLLPGNEWMIGGPSGADQNEICVQGDLSRREVCLRRQANEYVLQPLGAVQLGARRLTRPEVLRDGDRFTVGSNVIFEFSLPHPLSASAALALSSRQRLQPRCDGIILVADTCILSPTRSAHVVVADLIGEEVLLYRSGEWFVRGGEATTVDGIPANGRTKVCPGSRLQFGEVTMSLECLVS